MKFKDAVVLARSDDRGQLVSEDGRVEIRYRAGDPRAYRAAQRNLEPIAGEALLPDDTCPTAEPAAPRGQTRGGRSSGSRGAGAPGVVPSVPAGAIVVYADGACSGNPGPAGVGVVVVEGENVRELSAYLGEGTNNIAELTAVLLAAEAIEQKSVPVRFHTDSQYAIGVLTKGWKAKANVALIAKVKAALVPFQDLQMIHVRGHSGVPLNERADELAVEAVNRRASSGWVVRAAPVRSAKD
jgi:ribonuclease HI